MGNIFIARLAPTTVSTVAKELIQIQANASGQVAVHEVKVSAFSTVSQALAIALCFATTTGVAGTTAALNSISQAATIALSTAYGIAGSSNATGLTYVDNEMVNALNGYHFLPTPELRPIIKAGGRFVVRVDSTHPDDLILAAQVKIEEF